jgi:hypothetical protein
MDLNSCFPTLNADYAFRLGHPNLSDFQAEIAERAPRPAGM